LEKIKTILTDKFGETAIFEEALKTSPFTLLVKPEFLKKTCKELVAHNECYFDSLSSITGIDNGPEVNTMEVVYNLYSIPLEHHLMIKVILDRTNPKIDSVCDIWKTANWHERETFDLLGIVFVNHPDLRRLLMPADWEGHPLRKDYTEPERYRGMKTVREEDKT
jgi:NADH-quinone oxidoreductase subunit C